MTITTLVLWILFATAALAVARVLRSGTLVDRVLGMDLLLFVFAATIGVAAVHDGSVALLDAPLVLALLGVLGTVAAAIWLDRRGGDTQ